MKKLLCLVIVLVFGIVIINAQVKDFKDVSIDALLTETQLMNDDPNTMEMIWWIPLDFWETTAAQDPSTNPEELVALKELMVGKELFAVVKGEIGYFGGITYEPLEQILKEFNVTHAGNRLRALKPEEISADLNNFLDMVSPMMANMFGEMGKNMHFIFLTSEISSETFSINATGDEKINISLGDDFSSTLQLPLGSLLMEKKCPRDGQLLSGKWTYCPYHGNSLKNQ